MLVFQVWNVLMSVVEWNKKEELVAEQALKHLRQYAPALLAPFTSTQRSELTLMVKVQEYCYDNMAFHKVFNKIILLFYKGKQRIILSVILYFYKSSLSCWLCC